MYIKRIVIENIRGFKSLDFNLERPDGGYSGWTVITGDNASGKTALLKAVSLAVVGPEVARILQPSFEGWIYKGVKVGRVALYIVPGEGDRFAQGRRHDKPFWAELQLRTLDDVIPIIHVEPGQKYPRKGKEPTRGPWSEASEGWFCVGYGPFRRMYGHSSEAQSIMSTPGKVSRFVTMFREDATLFEGDLWLRELLFKDLEKDSKAKDILAKVLTILRQNFLPQGMSIPRISSKGLWFEQSDGISILLKDMSDGYRSAIAMIVDIIRQLIDVYGIDGFKFPEKNRALIENSGVVLVDEIDAHLHPSWQRVIGDWFKRAFPNIQFIVTSHSPLICQAADAKGLFHLPPPGSELKPFQLSDEDYYKIIAGRPNEIYLSSAFELKYNWSPSVVKSREQYAKLQAKKSARPLTPEEIKQEKKLSLFVEGD